MKKSTKSVLAAGAAVVVLTGGAGSLAYWNATADIGGGEIDSGDLDLTPDGDGVWQLNGTDVPDPEAVVLVPGDVLTYAGAYTVVAVGDNIEATLTAEGAGGAGTLAPYLDVDLTATTAGAAVTTIDESNDGDTLDVDLTVDFPFGGAADNASKTRTLDLTGVSVVLTQTDATP
ncbi:alternate-type signal peptide domain-containing protein [Nocardioides sp. CFH 31398]|uniref:alternate-type signal peptide domain-containing protein n=1 Tax=Nocardioides sp. CFH 31398 TaxID=2919579 RepID=UPI001F05F00A|nr:alternate-type signal peptide domain-containing protein [Nocardioides sp. CFH 31398]MCH1867563.1 alternate-type signal peptide domain-containing protein [Nocardioides sp. CFH 31398]